jgi:hypothetical protein
MFRVFPAHHQRLNDCSGSLWFYLRIVVIVVLCSWSGRLTGPTTNTVRLSPRFFFFFFQALNFLVESFGLLNDLSLLPSILDAGFPVFDLYLADIIVTLSSHLYLGLPCDLLVRGFQLNIFLTVLESGILCT